MSSSYIMEPRENESKKDDTLIIVVNEDGIISVDQETLQNLIMNQSDANVSVVRLGQTEGDAGNGSITLTVDPPAFVPPDATSGSTDGPSTNDSGGLVDPFMEMDPEQLERLETALQSEEAKQILGENVTAMLDMLTVEEQQNSLKYSIQLDHCYTSRTCPSDPKPSDPLPIANSPDDDNAGYVQSATSPRSQVAPVTSNIANATVTPTRPKGKPGRPRKDVKAGIQSQGCTPKSTGGSIPRSMMNVLQGANKGALVPLIKPLDLNELHTASAAQQDGADEDGVPSSSSSESSESEPPSDNDSDFGPRGPRRGGVRARGGRKGLTTRGGSMAASRRRGSNKHMNIEQVRRLDMEMAAAVDAMKSPEKEDKSGEKFHPTRGRKQLRTFGRRKIEVPSTLRGADTLESSPASFEKTLHTTNQVKANLISANMIKGDMILTKPGQAKSNNQQKVIFVQKQVMMKTGELKNLGIKKQIVIPKGTVLSDVQGTKATKQAALTVSAPKAITQTTQVIQPKIAHAAQVSPGQPQTPTQQQIAPQSPPSQKVTSPAAGKTKASPEVKKEKKKSESISESPIKSEPDLGKLADTKTPDASKKPPKREQRKSPAILADTLGPALFSTPDIIRRVGSTGEPKTPDTPVTPVVPTATGGCTAIPIASSASVLPDTVAASGVSNAEETSTSTTDGKVTCVDTAEQSLESAMEMDNQSAVPANNSAQKTDTKVPLAEDLQPSIDSASNSAPPEGVVQPAEEPIVPNHIVSQSNAMEGEEQLLATLEMEASKHEEELLAEALLLQEELGVDLAEHATLVEQTPAVVSEPLMSSPTFTHSVVSSIEDDAKAISGASAPAPPSPSVVAEQSKKIVRDEKEPIQIIRGGRIITLPPIEAPATRSKKLQAKGESVQKKSEVSKKNERFNKQSMEQRLQRKEEINMNIENEVNNGGEGDLDDDDDDDEEEAEDDNSDSEDDPDRLWCICKRPHNNRFMICCDVCEDWFHGKCVHVSKAMGQEMEEKGIEWVCPNCTKKKAEEAKPKVNLPPTPARHQKALESSLRNASASPRLQNLSIAASVLARSSAGAISNEAMMAIPGVTQCMVCKKEARASSIYCSDACILTHAQESLTKDKSATPEQQSKALKSPILDAARAKPDGRVIVFERKSGKVLTGVDAPTRSNLRVWLKENPTFEVVRPDNLNTLQIGGKTVTAIQTQGVGRMNKAALQAGRTPQGQSKMIFTKVPGSKQTVLAASNKKIVVISGAQQSGSSPSPKTVQSKQMPTAVSRGAMGTTKQILPKTAMVQSQIKSQPSPVAKQAGKKQQEIKTPATQQKVQLKLPTMRKPETEPIRLNVRKTLAELLTTRIRETEDLKLSDDEIGELALNIELELFKFFKDTGAKYKAKYRSLVFNIKDTKNLTLFRKVADRSLTPDAVVRLSPDEMASQELAEWREKETKHQLEMIKKNELDMMSQAKSIVVKTHKGEQIIENDGAVDRVDPKTPVQDIVTALNSAENITSTVDDEDREKGEKPRAKGESKRSKSSGEDKRKKDKGRDREKDSGRDREKEKEKRESRSKKRRHSGERERSRTRERSRDRRSTRSKDARRDRDRDREREKEREKERERDRERDKEKYKKGRGGAGTRGGGSGGRDYKDKDKKEGERKREAEKKKEEVAPTAQQQPPPPTLPAPAQEKPIEDRLWRHVEDETSTNTFDGNDSDVSDREPSSTVTIKTPDINEELEREREPVVERDVPRGPLQTAWRGFVNMVDVAKFFITAQEVSGHARDLMDDLPDTVDVVGRISHETVWDYISKMKKTGSKEILVIRLTAANDEEKIPYITLYSYLNSRSRLGVVGNVSKNIKDFYIMPFSSQSELPSILLPLDGPGFEARRPHLLLGIIVRNKRKRASAIIPVSVPSKIAKKESTDRSYTPPLMSKDKTRTSTPPPSPKAHLKTDPSKEKQTVTQLTLETLNKAHVGMSRNVIDSETISKIVPELSSKIDLTSSPSKMGLDDDDDDNQNNDNANNDRDDVDVNNDEDDDGDEPYSPGDIDDDNDNVNVSGPGDAQKLTDVTANVLSPAKNSSELQRKMDELNRQIEEQKQQIQNISSSFLKEATSTLPGLGLDPAPGGNDSDEAYSPTDSRSFTPPPPGIPKFSQPILDKVSDITIPPNLQEILANVKRQESSKVDPYLPSKPSASFLPTSITSSGYQNTEKYTPSSYSKIAASSRAGSEKLDASQSPVAKESKSTLRSLSDLDLIKKAEEELAAVAAATAASVSSTVTLPDLTKPPPPITVKPSVASSMTLSPALSPVNTSASRVSTFPSIKDTAEKSVAYKASSTDLHKKSLASDQPKPPGLEDEDYPLFPSSGPPSLDESPKTAVPSKFVPKSGVVLSVKRKVGETPSSVSTPIKAPRTKSRWGQGPAE